MYQFEVSTKGEIDRAFQALGPQIGILYVVLPSPPEENSRGSVIVSDLRTLKRALCAFADLYGRKFSMRFVKREEAVDLVENQGFRGLAKFHAGGELWDGEQ